MAVLNRPELFSSRAMFTMLMNGGSETLPPLSWEVLRFVAGIPWFAFNPPALANANKGVMGVNLANLWDQHALFQRAADALFGFTHRAPRGKALWSDALRVWLGSATFLHWAINEADVDIPRMVVKTAGAPQSPEGLHEAVYAELTLYWADRLVSLPSKSSPGWLPLP